MRRENTYTNRGAEQLRADVHNAASYRDVACAQRCKAEETVHVGPGRATETENEEDEQDSMHKTIDQNTFTGSTQEYRAHDSYVQENEDEGAAKL